MKVLRILMLAGCVVSLAACQTIDHPNRVKVEGDGYAVEVESQEYHEGGYPKHCPPGHAMKGWCDYDN